MENPDTMKHRILLAFAVFAAFSVSVSFAKPAAIASTGYTIQVPDTYAVGRPAGAPDILLQCDSPDGNASIQVVKDLPNGIPESMASVYEAKMRGALPGFSMLSSTQMTSNGRPALWREYSAPNKAQAVHVMALFYSDGKYGFIVHSLDVGKNAAILRPALSSLRNPAYAPPIEYAPPRPAAPSQPSAAGQALVFAKTGFQTMIPRDWSIFPGQNATSVQAGSADKKVLMEVTWFESMNGMTPEQFANAATNEMQKGLVGTGTWYQLENWSRSEGAAYVIHRRFSGSLGAVPSEILLHSIAVEGKFFLAYGYYGQSLRDGPGQAMLAAMSGIGRAAPPPPPAPPVVRESFKKYIDRDAMLGVAYPESWLVETSRGSTTIAGPAGSPDFYTTINVQSAERDMGVNRDLDTFLRSFSEEMRKLGGRIQQTVQVYIAGMRAYRIDLLADIDGASHAFRYYLVERPSAIAVVSFVAPVAQWNAYLELVSRLEARITPEEGADIVQPAPPAAQTPPQSAQALATSRETYLAMRNAAKEQRWRELVSYLSDKSLASLCQEWMASIPEAGITRAKMQADPGGVVAICLEYFQKARDRIAWIALDGTITGIREESPDMHLVMVDHGPKGARHFWMLKTGGRWLYDF
jgi:hypothetical protein